MSDGRKDAVADVSLGSVEHGNENLSEDEHVRGNKYLYEKLLRGREAARRGEAVARDLVEEGRGRA